ncbi:MAG: hypothetical protein ACREKB_12100 [Candidatus Rokuibacteriota bacterium]
MVDYHTEGEPYVQFHEPARRADAQLRNARGGHTRGGARDHRTGLDEWPLHALARPTDSFPGGFLL